MPDLKFARKRSVRLGPFVYPAYLLFLLLILMPHPVFGQCCASNAEWIQYKSKCGLDPNMLYNDWAKNPTCPGSNPSSTTTVPSTLPGLTSQQQLGMQIGMLGANMIGQGLHQLLAGPPPAPVDPAQQQRQLAAQQLNNSGIYLLKQKNYAGAINEFQQALAITPGDATIQHNLAVAKQQLRNVAVAGQTSGALSQLLGGASSGSPSTSSGQLSRSQGANPNGSALSLVNLDSDSNVVDLRGTTKNAVDPTTLKNNSSQISTQAQASQTTVRALDSALGTGPASQDAQHPEANGAPTAQAETLAQSPDAAQTSKSIDQALGQNQTDDAPQTAGGAATANVSNSSAAVPAAQLQPPNSKLLDSAQNPDYDGRTTGNGPIGNGGANSAPATPAASVPSAPPAVAAPAATGNNSNSAPAGPAGHPQSTLNPQTANSIANPDFDGRATGNAPLQNFSPNANSGVAVTAAPATATAQPVTGGTTNFFGTKTSIPSLLPAPTQPNPQPATPMPVATDTNAWNAACPRAAAPPSGAAGPTAIDLAANPELADIDRIELQQVDAHMARLHKELDVLQKRDQDVLKEGEELHQEMVEQDHEIDWQALSFVTAGLGEVLKTASAANVQQAESIEMSNIWGELGVEKANLQNMLASSHGQEADELKAAIAAYDQVDRAHKLKNNVELGFKLQDAMIVETEELKHLSALDPKTADVLFESSVMMGRLAIVFGKGVVEKCSAVAAFGEPFTEASAIYVMMLQEEQQMKELGNGLADRQTMRRQIDEQLGELENKQQMLRVEIQRADPCARLGSN